MTRKTTRRLKVLAIDVGGSHVKCLVSGHKTPRKFKSGPTMTPKKMIEGVRIITNDWKFDVVSIGFPSVVRDGVVVAEPVNLGSGWAGYDFRAAFGCPVRTVNDAVMQAFGAYRGGKMLFLGLGTGLGAALVVDGITVAMELGHLRYIGGHDYEHYLGERGLKRLGEKKWRYHVAIIAEYFRRAFVPGDTVIGGGNVLKLKRLPAKTRRGSNADALRGGFRLWELSEAKLKRVLM